MKRNLILIAFRNLKKNKLFSLLNIGGLGIGIAVFLLLAQYVKFERSYESFIPERADIYRVKFESYRNNELISKSAENYPGVGPALKNELKEITSFARLYNAGYKNNVVITNPAAKPEPIAFKQKKFMYADSSFLPMMDYPMLKGNAKTALSVPFTAVISETCARKYFGNADPLGKMLHLRDDDFTDELAKVTGVFKDLPANTHLKFDVLFSYQTLLQRNFSRVQERYQTGWKRKDMYVFVQLQPGTDPAKVESKFQSVVNKYQPASMQGGLQTVLGLQPLTSIHLNSDLAEEPEPNGSSQAVFFLGVLAIFVLSIAWINYINLSTAKALERAKEVGVRKVIGALKSQLITQFLIESALINFVSIVLAFILATLSLSYFNSVSGLSLSFLYLIKPWFILLLIVIWIAGTFLSGFYPALVLSSFKPVIVLKGKLKNNSKGIVLRKGLVVTQFIASIALISGTLIIYKQLNFMMSSELGMNIEQVLIVERPAIADTNQLRNNSAIDYFKAELKNSSSVNAVSASLTVPGKLREFKVTLKNSGDERDSVIVRANTMDYDFIDVFKMKLLAGRNFSKNFIKDQDTAAIITETTSKLLGYKDPQDAIGKNITITELGSLQTVIVGVVNDYHQVSLRKPIDPGLFLCKPYYGEFYSIRLKSTDLKNTIAHIEKSWTTAFPGNPFEYFFLDDYFNHQYENEKKFTALFTTFSILAIVIGCIGLFGLSAYTATQRIKEIGIRKVLGATVNDITAMLSKDFLKLIGIAALIATPLAWWAMNEWLLDFTYRIEISWWIFLTAGGIAFFIAMITIGFQAVKVAFSNPVKNLRTE